MTTATEAPAMNEAHVLPGACDPFGWIWDAVRAPFSPEDIEWRVGQSNRDETKAMVLAYIDSRAVQHRLDEVFGPAGWSTTMHDTAKGMLCTLTVTLPDGSVVSRTDGADYTDVEPTKGGISSALKRAFAQLGGGRYLYELPDFWVDLVRERGNGLQYAGRTKDKSATLYFRPPTLPAKFLPSKAGPAASQERRPAPAPEPKSEPAPSGATTAPAERSLLLGRIFVKIGEHSPADSMTTPEQRARILTAIWAANRNARHDGQLITAEVLKRMPEDRLAIIADALDRDATLWTIPLYDEAVTLSQPARR